MCSLREHQAWRQEAGMLALCCSVSWADHPFMEKLLESGSIADAAHISCHSDGPVLRVKGALLIVVQEQQVYTGTLPDKLGHMATLCYRAPWVLQGNLHSCSQDTDLQKKNYHRIQRLFFQWLNFTGNKLLRFFGGRGILVFSSMSVALIACYNWSERRWKIWTLGWVSDKGLHFCEPTVSQREQEVLVSRVLCFLFLCIIGAQRSYPHCSWQCWKACEYYLWIVLCLYSDGYLVL